MIKNNSSLTPESLVRMSTMVGKILIVDDELAIQKLLTRYLVPAGYTCYTVGNVAEAKDALEKFSFDLLITDLKMPDESGLDLLHHAKEQHPHVGRIVITGFGSPEIASEIMEVGVYGYVIKPITRNIVLITVENALRHSRLDQHMLASKEELQKKVLRRNEKLTAIMNNLNVGVVMIDKDTRIMELNKKMFHWFPETGLGKDSPCCSVCRNRPQRKTCEDCAVTATLQEGKTCEATREIVIDGVEKDFRIITSPIAADSGEIYACIALYEDFTEKVLLERDLRQAQKLEAIGQLAAGIAHEINTPVQYIGDNMSFLQDSFEDITTVLKTYDQLWGDLRAKGRIPEDMHLQMTECLEDADIEYLYEEIPVTMSQSQDGVRRVDKIVKAMKDFSHPGEEDKIHADINNILKSTIIVCRNEWKYVAEVETDFASDLPMVPCYSNDLSQTFLNLIVNGAHAIADVTEDGKQGRGKISITSKFAEDRVIVWITDSGGGVPKEIQDKIFDPFFTTKKLGKGTGQGLSIARRAIVEKHQGNIFLEAEEGKGTTFIIEIPV